MKTSLEEQLTIDEYNKSAESWAIAHWSKGFWKEELAIFKKYLPSGKVLEIGCGGGRDAEELIELGYDYTGTDPAKNFIQVAKKRNPSGKFFIKGINELDFKTDTFDGFWASAVLLHIPKNKIKEALGKISHIIKNGGIGFISIKEGEGEGLKEVISSDGVSYKLYWSFYSREEFQQILEENGFTVLKFLYKPVSERTKWLIYFVKKHKVNAS